MVSRRLVLLDKDDDADDTEDGSLRSKSLGCSTSTSLYERREGLEEDWAGEVDFFSFGKLATSTSLYELFDWDDEELGDAGDVAGASSLLEVIALRVNLEVSIIYYFIYDYIIFYS